MILIAFSSASCEYFSGNKSEDVVAQVNEKFLYHQDLIEPTKHAESSNDSIRLANMFVNNWAMKQLLLEKAKFNLPKTQQQKFDELAENYRYELYTQAYKDALVEKAMIDSISETEIEAYYEEHKENFKTNENLLKIRYLHLSKNLLEFDELKKLFFRFNPEDKRALEDRSLEFKNYMLNDSIWVRAVQVLKSIPVENKMSQDEFLNQTEIEIEDSTSVYLVRINKNLPPKSTAPLSYVKPTVEQILRNKKKLKTKKEIEKEIIDDAIKNNEFKIFKK